MKRVWHGMKLMSGYSNGGKKACQLPKTTAEYADDLHLFFDRFDKYDFSAKVENLRISLSKAAGPGKLSPRVLKLCSNQLAYIFSVLYICALTVIDLFQQFGRSHVSFQCLRNL